MILRRAGSAIVAVFEDSSAEFLAKALRILGLGYRVGSVFLIGRVGLFAARSASSGGLIVKRARYLLRGEDLPQVVDGELLVGSTRATIGSHHELLESDLVAGVRILVARRL